MSFSKTVDFIDALIANEYSTAESLAQAAGVQCNTAYIWLNRLKASGHAEFVKFSPVHGQPGPWPSAWRWIPPNKRVRPAKKSERTNEL